MPGYSNMAWPDDPYGTGQLWRQEPHLLTGLAVCWAGEAGRAVPVCYAVTYLRLHRARPVDLTSGVSFGFRAVVAATGDEVRELVRMLDLDVLRARRLAKVVAGCSLARDLHAMDAFALGEVGRGIRGLAAVWRAGDGNDAGLARIFDIAGEHAQPESELAVAAASARIDSSTVRWAFAPQRTINALAGIARGQLAGENTAGQEPDIIRSAEWLGACSTERALVCALTAGRMLDRHTWEGLLDIGEAMAANTWDCFGSLDFDRRQSGSSQDSASTVTGGAS
jgi:hypothetical protein